MQRAVSERALRRANVAPTQSVLAAVRGEDGGQRAIRARFGLAPAWAKLRDGPSLINTRDDKLASSGVRQVVFADDDVGLRDALRHYNEDAVAEAAYKRAPGPQWEWRGFSDHRTWAFIRGGEMWEDYAGA